MNLVLSEQQLDLQNGAREFLEATMTPEIVRQAWNPNRTREDLQWKSFAEMGFLGLTSPECAGGLGKTELEFALIMNESGRVAAPGPFMETMLTAMTIAEAGTAEHQSRWLKSIVNGDCVAGLYLADQPFVCDADLCDILMIEQNGLLYLVEPEEYELTRQPAVDGARHLFSAELAVKGPPLTSDPAALARLRDRAALGTSATLLGISEALFERTVAYVKERNQFGRPIGSFQAVKHKLAECRLMLTTSLPPLWSAAWLLANDDDAAPVAVSVAKAYIARTSRKVNDEALQCHGGIGFTWEHDLHMWLKRAKALEQAYGSTSTHRQRIAAFLLASDPNALDL